MSEPTIRSVTDDLVEVSARTVLSGPGSIRLLNKDKLIVAATRHSEGGEIRTSTIAKKTDGPWTIEVFTDSGNQTGVGA